mmetsp:Transcript_4992/g.22513  ORF Transcript_4992/g.22513 Transcript_4992/m.22513 type:complete len:253 (+) Transcript_4992:1809-2567(+)
MNPRCVHCPGCTARTDGTLTRSPASRRRRAGSSPTYSPAGGPRAGSCDCSRRTWRWTSWDGSACASSSPRSRRNSTVWRKGWCTTCTWRASRGVNTRTRWRWRGRTGCCSTRTSSRASARATRCGPVSARRRSSGKYGQTRTRVAPAGPVPGTTSPATAANFPSGDGKRQRRIHHDRRQPRSPPRDARGRSVSSSTSSWPTSWTYDRRKRIGLGSATTRIPSQRNTRTTRSSCTSTGAYSGAAVRCARRRWC